MEDINICYTYMFQCSFTKQKENLQQINQSEPVLNKSPKETPTKTKKNVKDSTRKKDENVKEEKKEEKKETVVNINAQPLVNKESPKETKEHKEASIKDAKEVVKESVPIQPSNKESKKTKKKNDILAQIGKLLYKLFYWINEILILFNRNIYYKNNRTPTKFKCNCNCIIIQIRSKIYAIKEYFIGCVSISIL